MSIDRTTETISHFVGHFDIALEQLRLRAEYNEFKAKAAIDAEVALLESGRAAVENEYGLKDFDPDLKFKSGQNPSLHESADVSAGPGPVQSEQVSPSPPIIVPAEDWVGPVAPAWILVPQMVVPMPSSVATITVQIINLFDADVIGEGAADFTGPSVYYDQLVDVVAFAKSLSAPFVSPLDGFDSVKALYGDGVADLVAAFEAPEVEGLETAVFRDEEVEGTVIDGEVVDEVPTYEALLPEAIRAKRGLDENGEPLAEDGDEDALPDYIRDPTVDKYGSIETDPWGVDPGHKVHTGMNEASNEVTLTTSMIDAGVIVVGGDVMNLISISQVNVASDHDIGTALQDNATTALNIAEVLKMSDALPDVAPDDPAPEAGQTSDSHAVQNSGPVDAPAPVGQTGVPGASANAHTGSATQSAGINGAGPVNGKAKGLDKTSKPDRDDVATDQSVYTGLPKTWTVDTYEGDVIQLNSFLQASFILDSDRVDFSLEAAATYLGTGENLTFNLASVIEIGFGYDLIIVNGDLIDMTMVSQTNVLLDDDQVFVDGDVTVSGADNLLLNYVSIAKHGIDSYEDIEDKFEDTLDDLEDGIEDLSDEVVEDDLFLGVEGLRALYITGDLIKVTTVSQTNVMGDQDQVKLALDNFARETDGMVEVVTGSNVLTNSAVIEDLGFDSVVMAAGDVYDDALLYQAELIDTDAAPTGVDLQALATEAVAFLADDMIVPDLPDGALTGSTSLQSNDAADVLQTMTA